MLKIIDVDKIKSGRNVRNEKDNDILELAESIDRQGLINPILVRKTGPDKYEVIAGHRRLEAVKRLGLPQIECNITDNVGNKEIVITQIAENVQRKNMSAFELVETFERLKNDFNMNQKSIATMLGKSDAWVCNQYQAVKLAEQQYKNGDIPQDVKAMTYSQIKTDVKKKMAPEQKIILCKGMKVKVVGHTYTLFCADNAAENALVKFIESRRGK